MATTESVAPTTTPPSSSAPVFAAAGIAVLLGWAYWPALWGGFIWDDNSYVANNPLLHDVGGLWRIWFELTATPQYHPLVFTSFWIEYQIWGDATFGYHAVNVALHGANTFILLLLLQRLGVPGAWFAAAVFALHPVHVESVAWISERKDVLSTFFYGLTMLWWVRFLETQRERDWVIALVLAAATLLSKTVLCTLPAAMALVAWWKAPQLWRVWAVRLVPFIAISVPIALLTMAREHSHGNPPLPYTLAERTLIASRALWTHVGMLVWPSELTIVYSKWEVAVTDALAYVFPIGGLAVFATLLALRSRFGNGPLVGAAFFVVTLAPMIGFIDFNIMRYAYVADHFQYVAGSGLIALAGAAGAHALRRWSVVPAVVLVGILAVLARQQAGLYVDADTIWQDNVAKNPRSWVGYTYLATELMRKDRFEESATVLREAIANMPDNAEAARTLGVVEAALGRTDEALMWTRRARQLDPNNPRAAQSLGAVQIQLGQVAEAAASFTAAVELNPEYAEAWHYRGLAAGLMGRRNEAIRYLEEALRWRPDLADARADLEAIRESD